MDRHNTLPIVRSVVRDWRGHDLCPILDATGIENLDRLRIIERNQRAVLLAEGTDGEVAAVFADSGETAAPLTIDDARAIGARFSGTDIENVEGPVDWDQWIVHQQFDRYRPYYRVRLADSAGTVLYVAAVSGEVVQRTNRTQRVWNYAGSIVHWIYPTFIRKHWALWDGLVWWLSLIAIAGVGIGIVLGLQRMSEARHRGRRGVATPFSGWLGWHHRLGVVLSLLVTTWIVSGWLSMDHGRLFSTPEPTQAQISSFRGITIREAASRLSPELLQRSADAKAIEISAIDGRPLLLTRHDSLDEARLIGGDGRIASAVSPRDVESAIAAAWPGTEVSESFRVAPNDAYAHLREGSLGTEVLRAILTDDVGTWVHVDLANGRIVSVMDRSRRVYRWLYNGLHSLDFPGLSDRRPLWDLVMLVCLAAGFAFCVTGTAIGYRRLRTTLKH